MVEFNKSIIRPACRSMGRNMAMDNIAKVITSLTNPSDRFVAQKTCCKRGEKVAACPT
jgi:hypothetical protein